MKLLFDQNLSPDLPRLLADLFPESLHVISIELDAIEDGIIWEYAKSHDFIVATKDKDYREIKQDFGTAAESHPDYLGQRSHLGC